MASRLSMCRLPKLTRLAFQEWNRLSSEDGERHVVFCANGHPAEADEATFLDAAGTLVWNLYCG